MTTVLLDRLLLRYSYTPTLLNHSTEVDVTLHVSSIYSFLKTFTERRKNTRSQPAPPRSPETRQYRATRACCCRTVAALQHSWRFRPLAPINLSSSHARPALRLYCQFAARIARQQSSKTKKEYRWPKAKLQSVWLDCTVVVAWEKNKESMRDCKHKRDYKRKSHNVIMYTYVHISLGDLCGCTYPSMARAMSAVLYFHLLASEFLFLMLRQNLMFATRKKKPIKLSCIATATGNMRNWAANTTVSKYESQGRVQR